MTETCSQVATDGFALLGSELRIADDGELLVRGRAVASRVRCQMTAGCTPATWASSTPPAG